VFFLLDGIKDAAYTFGGRIALLIIALVNQGMLAWILGPADRGSLAVCLIFTALLTLVFSVGCDVTAIYFVASKKFTISEGITHTLVFAAFISVSAIGAGFILIQTPFAFFSKATPSDFYLALFLIPIALVSTILRSLLAAVREFGWLATSNIAVSILDLITIFLFVFFFSMGVTGALVANILVGLITIIGMVLFYRWKHDFTLVRPSLNKMRLMLGYGIRYYFGKISNKVNFQMGTIILAFFATREEVGFFALATLLMVRMMILPNTIGAVILPRIASDKKGRPELVAQSVRLTGSITALLLILVGVFAKPIIALLFSPAFLPAVPLVWILIPGIAVRGACKMFVPYLNGTNRPEISSLSVVYGALANLTLLAVFMPIMGMPGAAVAMVGGYLVSSVYLAIYFQRLSGLGFPGTWLFRQKDWGMVKELARIGFGRFVRT
jgi:O-antigen/teichoic acid export membrane protein